MVTLMTSDPTDAASTQPVRRWLLYRATLELLTHQGPSQRAEVISKVGELLASELTDYEKATFRTGDETPRWANNLAWGTTDMVAAGWMTKHDGLWAITDSGREALASHPDGVGLDVESTRAYRERLRASRPVTAFEPRYVPILEAALEFIEPGQWSTYTDLAAVASTNPQTVGNYMGSNLHRRCPPRPR